MSLGDLRSNDELSLPFRFIYSGPISKRTSGTNEWKIRYCVVVYGIFAYFRKQEKAEKFINSLPIHSMQQVQQLQQIQQENNQSHSPNSNDGHNFQRSLHIEAFRQVLKHRYPPRGYIKLLNRNGIPVSSVETSLNDNDRDQNPSNINNDNKNNNNNNTIEWSFSIVHNNRTFDLQCKTKESLIYWLNAFENLGVPVKRNNINTININGNNDRIITIHEESSLSINFQSLSMETNLKEKPTRDSFDDNEWIGDKENIGVVSNIQINDNNIKNVNNNNEMVICDRLESESSNLSKQLSLPESMIKNHQDDSEIEKNKRHKIEEKDKQLAKEQEELLKLLSQDNNKILQGFNHLQEFIKKSDSTQSLNVSDSDNDHDDAKGNRNSVEKDVLDDYSSGIVPQSQE